MILGKLKKWTEFFQISQQTWRVVVDVIRSGDFPAVVLCRWLKVEMFWPGVDAE